MTNATVWRRQGTHEEGNAAQSPIDSVLDWRCVRPTTPTVIQEAFLAGQCDGWSSDVSQLTACARHTRTERKRS